MYNTKIYMEKNIRINQDNVQYHETDTDPRVYLAIERTILALERTQLAWIRTVMVMMTAGFALDKGLDTLHKARLASGDALMRNGHAAGVILNLTAVVLMLIVTILHIKRSRKFVKMQGAIKSIFSPDFLLSFFVILIGCLLIYFLNFDGNEI